MKLVLFAKHLKGLPISALVQETKLSGVDGLDFPVRPGFAVNPDNVTTALPELTHALKSEGLCVAMVTSDFGLTHSELTFSEPLLAAMAQNGVHLLKIGYFLFDAQKQDYWQEVERLRRVFAGWAKLGEKHGVTVCYHTHSGPYMGSTASSLMHLIRDLDPKYFGAYLDAGHLSAAGEEFPMACSIAGKHLRIVGVKEVVNVWKETDGHRKVQHVEAPIGQGWLDMPVVFSHLIRIGFDGPLSLHVEYPGSQAELIESGKRDAQLVRKALKAASGK